jgi:arsenite methyltransferase
MQGQEEEYIKEKVKERYGKIALTGNSDCCCIPGGCCSDGNNNNNHLSAIESTKLIGYDSKDIESIPEASVLGVGCGVPTKFAEIKEGETIVDLGSGAGIDVFLAANKVGKSGKVIGVDMTDEMLQKARKNAKDYGYANVEFVNGDIERRILVDNNTADLVIRKYASRGYMTVSAGTRPAGEINPVVVQAMKEIGIDISNKSPRQSQKT